MTYARKAVVAGGGIAGLTAAASLVRAGWAVTVLEQARAFGEVGAGLAITPNGLSALAVIGADAATRNAGCRVRMAGTTDERGKWLMRAPSNASFRHGQEVYGIHRQQLHGVLLGAARQAELVSGVRVTGVFPGDPAGQEASVECVDVEGVASVFEADLIIGADGVNSAVRTLLAPRTVPRFSGKSSWRGIVEDSSLVTEDFIVRWGPGTEFGAMRIGPDRVYWYGYTSSDEGHRWPNEQAAAARHFRGWAEQVQFLIAQTPEHRVIRHDVYALGPALETYVHGRVVLIGDAAHAMLPTMGQGANSSLEDGACVGLLIGRPVIEGTPLQASLATFDAARRPRTQSIARQSHRAGRIGAGIRSRLGIAARNALLRAVPAGPAMSAGASLLSWEAPV